MNYFTTSLMKNLFSNDNNLPAFEQAVTELFRSELEKSLNEILAYELTAFLDYEPYARTHNENMELLRSIFQEIEWENFSLLFCLNTEDEIYLPKQRFWICLKKE